VEDYTQGAARWAEALVALPGVVSVGVFGQTGAPGLSDLDLVVFMDAPPSRDSYQKMLGAAAQDPLLAYMVVHPPMILPLALASRLWLVHSVTDPVFLAGQPLPPAEQPPEPLRQALAFAQTFDFAFYTLLEAANQAAGRVPTGRALMLFLRSASYSVRFLARLAGPGCEAGFRSVAEVDRLRHQTMQEARFPAAQACEEVRGLVIRELFQAFELAAEAFLHSALVLPGTSVEGYTQTYPTRIFRYQDGAPGAGLTRHTLPLGKVVVQGRLPLGLGVHFAAVAEADPRGDTRGVHQLRLTRGGVLPSYQDLLFRRALALAEVVQFLRPSGASPAIPVGTGYHRAPVGRAAVPHALRCALLRRAL
jgi:hypothetical protein